MFISYHLKANHCLCTFCRKLVGCTHLDERTCAGVLDGGGMKDALTVGWTDELTDRLISGSRVWHTDWWRTDERTDERINERTNGRRHARTVAGRLAHERTDGRITNGWLHGRAEVWKVRRYKRTQSDMHKYRTVRKRIRAHARAHTRPARSKVSTLLFAY